MSEKVLTLIFMLVLSLVLVNSPESFVVKAEPKTIVVPDDYSSIVDAVGNATEGDTIFVKSGRYDEPNLVINKTLTIIGENVNTTIINNIDKLPWDFSQPFPPSTTTLTIVSNKTGIYNLTISGGSNGIIVKSDGATIAGNIITTGSEAIRFDGSNNLAINNEITNARQSFHNTGSYNIIMNNSVSSGFGRIVLGRLPEITADSSGRGDTFFNVIYGNSIPSDGICISGSNNIVAKNNVEGVFIGSGSNNFVYGNSITAPVYGFGLYIMWGINNTIYANNVANCGRAALLIGGTRTLIQNMVNGTWVTNNTIHHNNFVQNDVIFWTGNPEYDYDVIYESRTGSSGYPTNNFDDGLEGNFYSDYKGRVSDKKGIGETPYAIDYSGNKDYHPLTKPFDISNVDIALPEWVCNRISIFNSPDFPTESGSSFEKKTFQMHNSHDFYEVTIVSNSTVSDFDFLYDLMRISFYVNGTSGTTGLCNVSIPSKFMSTEFSVFKDEKPLTKNTDFTQTFNGTHYLFTITYDHSTHLIQIYANNNSSEFPLGFILFFLAVVGLTLFVVKKWWKR